MKKNNLVILLFSFIVILTIIPMVYAADTATLVTPHEDGTYGKTIIVNATYDTTDFNITSIQNGTLMCWKEADTTNTSFTAFTKPYFGNITAAPDEVTVTINGTVDISSIASAPNYNCTVKFAVNNTPELYNATVQTKTVYLDNTAPVVTLMNPTDVLNSTNASIDFNCSVVDNTNITNTSLWHNVSSWHLNDTFWQGNNTYFNFTNQTFFTNITDGTYTWNCEACDNLTNCGYASANRTFSIDTGKALFTSILTVTIEEGLAIITWTSNESTNASVWFDTTADVTPSSNRFNGSAEFATSHSITLTGLTSNTVYYYNVSGYDPAGNYNHSIQYSFITTRNPATSGTSGGTTGGTASYWIKTITISDADFSDGSAQSLRARDRARVKVREETHYVGITDVGDLTANVQVTSATQEANLSIGDTAKFEVTGDNYYDVAVKLNSITDNKADVTIRKVFDKIISGEITTIVTGDVAGEEAEIVSDEGIAEIPRNYLYIIGAVILILIIIAIIYYSRKK